MAQLIQSGEANKSAQGSLVIPFERPFATPPTVVISPYYRGQNNQVGSIETLDEITQEDFTVVSDNAAPNYFVTWVAVGEEL